MFGGNNEGYYDILEDTETARTKSDQVITKQDMLDTWLSFIAWGMDRWVVGCSGFLKNN